MVKRILENAAAQGADAIACAPVLFACSISTCAKRKVNVLRAKEGKEPLDIPIYYFTELIAASFGADESKIGLTRHFHPADLHERAHVSWEADQGSRRAKRKAEEAAREAKQAQRKHKHKPKQPKLTPTNLQKKR